MSSLWPEKSWSQEDLISDFPGCRNLGDLIAASELAAKSENLVVCGISANGLRLTEEQEAQYKDTPLLEIKTFAIATQRVDKLLDDSLKECSLYLVKLTESMDAAAELFRSEDLVTAHKYYKTCVDGTLLFVEMLAHYKIVHQKARGDLAYDWKPQEDRLRVTLAQILDAYKKKNYILVADLLEYDLIEVLTTWREEIIKIENSGRSDNNASTSEVQT